MSESIKLNPQRKSDLEFDVDIQGVDENQTIVVRFVVEQTDFNRTFICQRVKDTEHTWVVNLPSFSWTKQESCDFHVEVIIDDYYFEPTKGTIELVMDKPEVSTSFKQDKSRKPKVSTSFNVKQEQVTEASGGGEVTGTIAPTNGLLKPETPPLHSSAKTADHSIADDEIDVDDLFDNILPGEGGAYTEDEATRDKSAREVVADMIKNVTGSVRPQTDSKRSLFKRDNNGNIIDSGFESPEVKRQKQERDLKVRQILDDLK